MTLRSAFRNVGYVGAVQVIRMALSLLIGIQVIRHLGPEAYGWLSIAMALALVISMPTSVAPNVLVVRELANRAAGERSNVIATALALRLTGAVLHVVLALAAIVLLAHDADIGNAVVLIAAGSFASAFAVTGAALELDGRFDTLSGISLASVLFGVALRLALVLADAGFIWFAAAMLLEAAGMAALNLAAYAGARQQLDPRRLDRPLAGLLLAESWPLALSALMVALYSRTDVLCITYFLDAHAAGVYSVAIRLTECWFFIPASVSSVIYPTLIKRRRDGPAGFYDLLTMSCGAGFWTAVVMALGITIATPFVLPALLGSAYDGSILPLQITAWSLVFLPLSYATASWLVIESMPRVNLYATFVTALVNVAANVLLVPTVGLAGAAIALVISHAIGCPLTLLIVGERQATAALLRSMSPTTLVRLVGLCLEQVRRARPL